MDAGLLATLDRAISGQVIGPDALEYDEARRTFNALIDRRPAAIARPTGPADVSAVLDVARAAGTTIEALPGRAKRLPSGVHGSSPGGDSRSSAWRRMRWTRRTSTRS